MNKRSFMVGMIVSYVVLYVLAYLGVDVSWPWSYDADSFIFIGLVWVVTVGVYDISVYAKRVALKLKTVIAAKIQERKKANSEEAVEKAA